MPAKINEEGDFEFCMGGHPLISWNDPKLTKEQLSFVSSMMNDVYNAGRIEGVEENKKAVRAALGIRKDLT